MLSIEGDGRSSFWPYKDVLLTKDTIPIEPDSWSTSVMPRASVRF